MSDRPRPPRARQPSFFIDDFYQGGTSSNSQHGSPDEIDNSPPTSSDHSHNVSSADYYRGVAPAGSSGPVPRAPRGAPPPVTARSTALNTSSAEDAFSPRSSLSEDVSNGLHQRHPTSAGPVPGSAPMSRTASWVPQAFAAAQATDRDGFFQPPAMPWVRSDSFQSIGGSRSSSPPFLGGGAHSRVSSASPLPYYPPSAFSQSVPTFPTAVGGRVPPKKEFTSNLLTAPIEKPWLKKRDVWATLAWWTVIVFLLIGAGLSAWITLVAYQGVPSLGKVCQVFNDDFTGNAINTGNWQFEVESGGFGNGEFEWTTNSPNNAFVEGGMLYIVPTLTSETGGISQAQILDNYGPVNIPGCTAGNDGVGYFSTKLTGSALLGPSVNKRAVPAGNGGGGNGGGGDGGDPSQTTGSGTGTGTGTGSGTGTGTASGATASATGKNGAGTGKGGNTTTTPGGNALGGACTIQSSASAGLVVNPVQSARLTTRLSANITYGRVEIRARLPTGDWMWPSISMLPVKPAYGLWPLSGEINIMEGRGNGPAYPAQGLDYITSGLNWGPSVQFNAFQTTRGWYQQRRTPYNSAFHDFVLEWDRDFLWVFVDKRIQRVIDLRFNKKSLFDQGNFPLTFVNGTSEQVLLNPWTGHPNVAPFDQPFYLVLHVAVGGTNGWFEDQVGGKPWYDRSNSAMQEFAAAQDTWSKTWPSDPRQRGMAIDYVRMYKQC